MGGSSSREIKTINEMVNSATTEIVMENTTECQVSATVKQKQSYTGTGKGSSLIIGDITQEAQIAITQECLQDAQKRTDVANALQRELENKINEKLAGIQLSIRSDKSKQTIHNKTENYINTFLKSENVAQAFIDANIEQDVDVKEYETVEIGSVTQVGSITALQKLAQRAWDENGISNDVKEIVKNEQEYYEENPVARVVDSIATGLAGIVGIPFQTAQALALPLIAGAVVIFIMFITAEPEQQKNLTGLVQSVRGPPVMGAMIQ